MRFLLPEKAANHAGGKDDVDSTVMAGERNGNYLKEFFGTIIWIALIYFFVREDGWNHCREVLSHLKESAGEASVPFENHVPTELD